jgi:hypothetical protein
VVKKYCLIYLLFPYFPLTLSIFFSKKIEDKRALIAGGKKILPTFVFSFLIFHWKNPSFSQKRLRKKDGCCPQTHFGAALYWHHVMLCTFWVIAWHEVYNGQHQNLGQVNGQLGKKEACGTACNKDPLLISYLPSHIRSSPPRHHLPEHSSPSCEHSSP